MDLQLRPNGLELEGLEHVVGLNVAEVGDDDAALHAFLDLADVLLEDPQRADAADMQDAALLGARGRGWLRVTCP